MTTSIFIDGGHGTTGLQIVERLEGRGELSLIRVSEADRRDPKARHTALNEADIVILCLPDDAAREAVSLIENDRTKVIDASTAHRTAPDWTFGFPEVVGRNRVAGAQRMSNPGCYSTGFIALVAPLVKAGILPADQPLTVNAASGYSGGGKAMIAEFEENGAAPTAWRTYALSLAHKHVPEMQVRCGLERAPLFAPTVVSLYSGMVVDVPLILDAIPGNPSPEAIKDVLAAAYEDSPVVSLVDGFDEAQLAIERLSDTDKLELYVFANAEGTRARLIAALDNLGKGAAGAAVQNLNLMAGLPETAGLRL